MPDQPFTPFVPEEEEPIKPFVIGVPDNVPPEVIDPPTPIPNSLALQDEYAQAYAFRPSETSGEDTIIDLVDIPPDEPVKRRPGRLEYSRGLCTPERSLREGLQEAPREANEVKRRRGGQPGNLNALKHGLYIEGYRLRNTTPIERAQLFDVNIIINQVKTFIQHTYDYGMQSKNMGEINETMRAIALAGMSLSRLIQVHEQFISSPLPHDMKINRKTNVNSLIDHLRKKLEPYNDLSGIDIHFLDEN